MGGVRIPTRAEAPAAGPARAASHPTRAGVAAFARSHGWFLALVVLCAGGAMLWRTTVTYPTDVFDLYPVYFGGRAWIQTGNAYATQQIVPDYHQPWDLYRTGNMYPLPAVLLTLPLSLLPPTAAATVWIGLLVVACLAALRLAGLSLWWACSLPILDGIRIEQYTILTICAQVVALWALRTRRPWVLALCCSVILTKPNQGLFFVIVVALLARNWRQQAVVFALVWGGSFLLDPNWLGEWLPTLEHYRALTQQPILWALALFALPFLFLRDWLAAATILQFLTLPFPTNSTYALGAVPLTVLDSRWGHWLTVGSYCWLLLVPLVGRPWAMALAVLLPTTILALARRYGWPLGRRGIVALGAAGNG